MAKKGHRQHIVLSDPETGHTYHTTKNKNNDKEKLKLKKYNPLTRKHAVYEEKK